MVRTRRRGTHSAGLEEGRHVNQNADPPAPLDLTCGRCKQPMVLSKVTVSYLGNKFSYDLLKCPGCGKVHVPEALATGKMLEVEQLLEDK
jgi:hypothetical protein